MNITFWHKDKELAKAVWPCVPRIGDNVDVEDANYRVVSVRWFVSNPPLLFIDVIPIVKETPEEEPNAQL